MISRGLFSVAVLLLAATVGMAQDAKKVSTAEALDNAVTKVQPTYPASARQLKIEGKVDVEAIVNPDGTVDDVQIKSGNPILTRAATDALKRWKFKPFMADGKPVKAVAPVSFTFKL